MTNSENQDEILHKVHISLGSAMFVKEKIDLQRKAYNIFWKL